MFGAGTLTFQEFMSGETLPLATIHDAVLDHLRGVDDAVLFGAYAVNAYVPGPRMTPVIDLLSPRAPEVAERLRAFLADHFHIAVRVREVASGRGHRVYQVRQEGNRHLVDVQSVTTMPAARRIAGVLVLEPVELIAMKVTAYESRRAQPKAGTDWRDIAELLLAFPELNREEGPVADRLRSSGADEATFGTWRGLVAQEIRSSDEDEL